MGSHFLYCSTNLVTGHFYIGKHYSNDIENDTYLGSGIRLKRSIKKYGKENFKRQILHVCCEEAIETLEILLVNEEMLLDPLCLNLALGGQGGSGPARCKSKESHRLSVAKTALKLKGRNKNTHSGVRAISEKLKGRSKFTHAGYSKVSEFRKLMVGDLSPRSKVTQVERNQIIQMFLDGIPPGEIQKQFPVLSVSGIKSVMTRYKREKCEKSNDFSTNALNKNTITCNSILAVA